MKGPQHMKIKSTRILDTSNPSQQSGVNRTKDSTDSSKKDILKIRGRVFMVGSMRHFIRTKHDHSDSGQFRCHHNSRSPFVRLFPWVPEVLI